MSDSEQRLDKIEQQLQTIANNQSSDGQRSVYGNQYPSNNDEIDLRELWDVLWSGKWWVIGVTFLFAVASLVYALSLPNIYKSEVLLAPAEENSGGGLAGMAGQLGGLASLAGVNLGGGGADKTSLALAVLKSREFIIHFVEKHDLLVPLMAAKGWDSKTDELLIDSDVYDNTSGQWVRKVSSPKKAKPSMQEAFIEFSRRLAVSQDKQTNFVSISVEFYSPSLSRMWIDWLVEDINLVLKSRDVSEAERSIEYLTGQLRKTSIADMKAIFYELIEEQTKTVMFAEVRDEYVFKTIDKAVVPELKFKPKRALILVLGVFLGSILAVFFLLIRYFLKKSE